MKRRNLALLRKQLQDIENVSLHVSLNFEDFYPSPVPSLRHSVEL